MSDFKAKMRQNRFCMGLFHRPGDGRAYIYSAPQRAPSWNKGDLLLSKGDRAEQLNDLLAF